MQFKYRINKNLLFSSLLFLTLLYSFYDQLILYYFDGYVIAERLYLTLSFISSLLFVYVVFDYKIKTRYVNIETNIFNKTSPLFLSWLVILLIVAYGIYNGIQHTYELGWFNRRLREQVEFYRSGQWALMKSLLFSAYLLILYHTRHDKRKMLISAIVAILLVSVVEIALIGGRRMVVGMIIPVVYFLIIKVKLKYLLYLLTMSLLMFMFGGIREYIFHGNDISNMNDAISSTLLSNEFQYVSSGISHYIGIGNDKGYEYGLSYIKPITYLLSFFWFEQVQSTGREFGFFISIFSEMILNFYWLSFFYFGVFILIYTKLVSRLDRFYSLILISLLMEMFRTSFLEFLLSFLMIYIFGMAILLVDLFFKKIFFIYIYKERGDL
jgi:hypothetical protein